MNAGNAAKLLLHDRQIIFRRRFARAPRLQDHSAETAVGNGNLKSETRVRNILEDFPGRVGITNRVVDGRIGRRGDDAENDSLVFLRAPVPSSPLSESPGTSEASES